MAKEHTKYVIVAARRIVGILSQEGSLDHFASYEYRGPAMRPEMEAKYCDFCGFVTRTAMSPPADIPKVWTVRLARRQPPAHALGSNEWRPEVLSYSFFGSAASMLKFLPSSILFIDKVDLGAFQELCRSHGIGYHMHTYDGEVAINPPRKTVAA